MPLLLHLPTFYVSIINFYILHIVYVTMHFCSTRDMKKSSGCNRCTHPSCGYGLNANGVASCSECMEGVLVLDLTSGPKWQLACNQ